VISREYIKALDLIRQGPLEHPEDDWHKPISIFKVLLEEGCDVGIDDIYQYCKKCGWDLDLASQIQNMHQIVKGTLNTEFGWDEDWLRRELFGARPSSN
jgi:hypothetical protein